MAEPKSSIPEGIPDRCPDCGKQLRIEPTHPQSNAPCPHCGSPVWLRLESLRHKLDYLVKGVATLGLDARTSADAVQGLVRRLAESGAIQAAYVEEVVARILAREELGSTGIGRGFAVPHGKHESVERCVCALGFSRCGIEFSALDGSPVRLFCLLVSPEDRPGDHLRALGDIGRALREFDRDGV